MKSIEDVYNLRVITILLFLGCSDCFVDGD